MKRILSLMIAILLSIMVVPISADTPNLNEMFSDNLIDMVRYDAKNHGVSVDTDESFMNYVKSMTRVGFVQQNSGFYDKVTPTDFRGVEYFENAEQIDVPIIVGYEPSTNDNYVAVKNLEKLPDKFVNSGKELNLLPGVFYTEQQVVLPIDTIYNNNPGGREKWLTQEQLSYFRKNFGLQMGSLLDQYKGPRVKAKIGRNDILVNNFNWMSNKNRNIDVVVELGNSDRFIAMPLHEHKIGNQEYYEIDIVANDIPDVVVTETSQYRKVDPQEKTIGINFDMIKKYVKDNLTAGDKDIAEFELLVELKDGQKFNVNQSYNPAGGQSNQDKFFMLGNSSQGLRGEINTITLRFPVTDDIKSRFESTSNAYKDYMRIPLEDLHSKDVVNHQYFTKQQGLQIESYYVNSDNSLRKEPHSVTVHFLPLFSKQYTVDFVSDGGYILPQKLYWEQAHIEQPTDPIREGYIFKGWYSDREFTNKWDFESMQVSSSMKLFAKWELKGVTVKFQSNGGSAVEDINLPPSGGLIPRPADPTRDGFKFVDWYSEPELKYEWAFERYKVDEDTTLYAKWEALPVTYDVTFETNGGSTVTAQSIESGKHVVEPTAPTKAGFTFEGWYKESTFTTAWNFATDSVSEATTLYAKWEAIPVFYDVTFESNGGSTVTSQSIESGKFVVEPTAPTKTGFTFEGWYKDSTFTTTWSFATDPVTEATTLYAKWEAIPVFYDVTFESNGGSTVTAQSIEAGKFVVEPTAPTKAGFTFEGWYKDSSLTTVWNFATDPVTEATTLYAKWEVIPVFYDVIFESNGGSTVTAQSIESGKFVVEPTAPTKTGFTFEGWYKESTFTTAWNFTTDPVTEATTLYAKWEAIPVFYDVTFESNGGSTVNPQSIESGKFVVEPTAPTKAGFTFEGWYKESTFTTTWNFATDPVTEATTLYAKWEAIPVFYDVTFESNGGSTVTSQSIESGKFVVEPTAPTKTGFTFEGWYKDSTFTTAWNFATDPVTEATTLYAKWEAIPVFYDVTFESNGGSTVNPQSIESGKFVVEPTAPTKAGFTFEGWYKDSGFTTAWNFTTDTVTEATTLYAKWEAIPVFYDVTFESNGGTPVKTLSVKSGNPITEVINPMKEGYLFKGWYKDSLLTTPWIFEIDLVTESITLYAKWEAIPVAYDVTFESNGGTSVASQSIESGKFIVEPTAPTKAGFTFKGWYKDSAFTTEWDFTKDTVTEPITLYAKWEKDTILPPTGISYTNSVMIGLTMVGLGFVIIGYRKKEKLSKS